MLLQATHITAFLLAVGGCLLATWRVKGISHAGTRHGLVGLFVLSAVWALGQAVLLANPPLSVARPMYMIALIAGFGTVWAWLYFCSAYAGHRYHKDTTIRRAGFAVFAIIVVLKLTNPIHGRYFTIQRTMVPFPHVQIQLLDVHEAVTVLAYSLTAIGFYLLFELFRRSDVSRGRLGLLVGLTGLPVILDMLSELGVTALTANTYVPLGVAAFGISALFLAEETFEQIYWASYRQLLDRINEGLIIVDDSGTVRDYNATAGQLFPDLRTGRHLGDAAEILDNGKYRANSENESRDIITVDRGPKTKYYLLNRTTLAIGPNMTGQALVITDVSTVERQRRELKRQSEQLDDFAAAVAHELRNTLTIAGSNLVLLDNALERGELAEGQTRAASIREATERMDTIVDDLSTLARLSQTATELDTLEFDAVVEDEIADAGSNLTTTVDADGQIRAEQTRLRELVRNLAMLANETETNELHARFEEETIEFMFQTEQPVVVDGLLEYGEAVPHAEAGMLGPNARTLARAQGWTTTVTAVPNGYRIEIQGITEQTTEGTEPSQ